jgi:uncharacterized peroxidase-related enzyme
MTFIQTVPEESAEGETAAMYAGMRAQLGYVPNFVKVFSHRPEVMAGWGRLLDSIKKNMDLRRYELVTIAAAKELRSSCCMLAHGSVLMRDYMDAGELRAIAGDPAGSALGAADKAIMGFAAKVIRDAASVTAEDVDTLRRHGLSEAEIFDVASAAAVRCFLSKTADALGARPDAAYGDLAPELRDVLVVGRPIAN